MLYVRLKFTTPRDRQDILDASLNARPFCVSYFPPEDFLVWRNRGVREKGKQIFYSRHLLIEAIAQKIVSLLSVRLLTLLEYRLDDRRRNHLNDCSSLSEKLFLLSETLLTSLSIDGRVRSGGTIDEYRKEGGQDLANLFVQYFSSIYISALILLVLISVLLIFLRFLSSRWKGSFVIPTFKSRNRSACNQPAIGKLFDGLVYNQLRTPYIPGDCQHVKDISITTNLHLYLDSNTSAMERRNCI